MSSVLTVEELAEKLRVAVSSAYGLVQRGDVRSVRVGRAIRIPAEAVDQFLSQQPDIANHKGQN
jgi:excisionase family DNA binding protein